jgi:methionine-rich copper-binding protein CopC
MQVNRMSRTFGAAGLMLAGLLLAPLAVWAQPAQMMESKPLARAVMDGRSDRFFVRFDRPVDHARSVLAITSGGKVVETLHPSLDASPDVLFAQAPRLPAGEYRLHWSVITMQGAEASEGDIPFTVKS